VTISSLRLRSYSKVNLALAVLGCRADGYHEIRTVFQSIDLHDVLEFRPARTIELECQGLPGIPVEENLVWRAATALAGLVSEKRGVAITLRKTIPPGSGLGGGSSNAAITLHGLNRFWGLGLTDYELLSLAGSLGSDVPFFLHGGTALGIGRGAETYPLPEVRPARLVVIYPGVHVSTAEAYGSLNLGLTSLQPAHRIKRFCSELEGSDFRLTEMFNDFEASILPAYPAIAEAKDFLRERGATAVLLSGSGSSVFGFFSDEESAFAASRAVTRKAWRVFPAKTLSRTEYLRQVFG
jgi:4-diphosphocytidyl-2-C-methyl-D-erythritol kinase